jgi:geranylgeranyl diphosphate synthase, type II
MSSMVREFHEMIEDLISEQNFARKPVELYQPIAYTMRQGGKRLRPVLTLLSCNLFGGDVKQASYPALAVEVFHNFTLVHDDIMDRAPLRRGMDTVYKKWNADIAILSGDTMFAMAYQYALRTEPAFVPDILRVFSKAAIEVCEGQQMDMNFETHQEVEIADYLEMIRLKTAVLLGAALEIGAIVGKAKETDVAHIYDFGVNLGIAFQLKDDLLDVFGNQKDFGKISGGDIAANKKTYLFLKALELANPEQKAELKKYYSTSDMRAEDKIAGVRSIFDGLQIEDQVSAIMKQYYDAALDALARINVPYQDKEPLLNFAEKLFHRTY